MRSSIGNLAAQGWLKRVPRLDSLVREHVQTWTRICRLIRCGFPMGMGIHGPRPQQYAAHRDIESLQLSFFVELQKSGDYKGSLMLVFIAKEL